MRISISILDGRGQKRAEVMADSPQAAAEVVNALVTDTRGGRRRGRRPGRPKGRRRGRVAARGVGRPRAARRRGRPRRTAPSEQTGT